MQRGGTMEHRLWIDGAWVDSQGGARMTVENPATEAQIAEVVDASRGDADRAGQAAQRAFYDGRWSRKTPSERSRILWRLADLIEARTEEFARLESENTGKPYQYVSLGADMPFVIDNLRFFASAARDIHGSHAGEYMSGSPSIFRREPVGVVGQIAPWNYPLMMAVWKMGPALAAGCTVVLKPAPGTPLTSLMLAELTKEAGIPDGVVNVISGGNAAGQAIVEHPDIRMISLTGSTATGKLIMKTAADTLKRVHLELGGKAPILVFDDADISLVAQKATLASTFNTGQDCTAATRVYAEGNRFKQVKEALTETMSAVKVGDPFDAAVVVGTLISETQRDRVIGFVERAKKQGATVLTGGSIPKGFDTGFYYAPTVICDVKQSDEIIQSEVFGPVITIQEFKNEDEAISLGNDVQYGFGAFRVP